MEWKIKLIIFIHFWIQISELNNQPGKRNFIPQRKLRREHVEKRKIDVDTILLHARKILDLTIHLQINPCKIQGKITKITLYY